MEDFFFFLKENLTLLCFGIFSIGKVENISSHHDSFQEMTQDGLNEKATAIAQPKV